MKNSLFSWTRFKGSFIYAWAGIWALLKSEQNLWIMLAIGVAVLFFAWYLDLTNLEKAILILVSAAVIAAEILNTAVEFIFDKFHPIENHEDVKIVKDIMAGLVLIWSIAAVVVGAIIFWPYLK